MSDHSKIEWTDATWNPIRARRKSNGKIGWHCEHVTPGCKVCYAERINLRLGTGLAFKPGHRDDVEIYLDETVLTQPLRWKKPRVIFPGSMTDLFADFVRDEWIDKIFAVMALTPQHTFQPLTKRAKRMRTYLSDIELNNRVGDQMAEISDAADRSGIRHEHPGWYFERPAESPMPPLANVWLGVSAERQPEADERIPELLATPAAVRFLSIEPLLGPMDLARIQAPRYVPEDHETDWKFDALATGDTYYQDCGDGIWDCADGPYRQARIDWVIVGGESGPDARPMHPDWARSLRDQCLAAGVPFFFKQWGEYLPVGQNLPDCGKVHGATAVKPGRMKLHYGGTPERAPLHAFAERGVEFASLPDGRLTFRVGKAKSGRLLDGVEHNEFPTITRETGNGV